MTKRFFGGRVTHPNPAQQAQEYAGGTADAAIAV